MKLAIVFDGDIYKQRGEFIAVRNRVKELSQYSSINVDVFVIKTYVGNLTNKLLKFNSGELIDEIYLDNIKYCCVWVKKSLVDFFLKKLLSRGTNIEYKRLKKKIDLSKYDLVYAHSLNAGLVALDNKMKNKVPYMVLWHGSSIHTTPFNDKNCYKNTQKVLRNADENLFVSDELQQVADNISNNIGSVTSNGIDTSIYKPYSYYEKLSIRESYNVSKDVKNIAFIGNCYPVKNVNFLPKLFTAINKEIPNTHFYLIGSGSFEELFRGSDVEYTCITNVKNPEMPNIYNIMDLVVLPSINEGLPMVCLEATACGVDFVGSRVGGIAQVVGEDRTVQWTDSFEQDFVNLCVLLLKNKTNNVKLPNRFRLSDIVEHEIDIMYKIVGQSKK